MTTALVAAPERPAPVEAPGRRTRGWVVPALLVAAVVVGGVLRAWHLSGTTLIWDETFTGSAARLPLAKLVPFLRAHDVHPPLDYLLRAPIAHNTTSEWLLRLPSAVASLGAVALTGWWLRRRGTLAVVATALMAVGAFQLTYAWEARAYAPMVLVGVALAWLAHRWLRQGGRALALTAGVVLLAGALVSESGLLLAGGLLLVPGIRRDPDAWWWRGSIAGAALLWVVAWGPVLLDQLPNVAGQAPVPHTTVHGLLSTLNELVDSTPALIPAVVLLVVAGGLTLARQDRHLARVWCCAFVAPVALTALLGARMHVLWPKTLAFASWGPMLALAAVVDLAARRWRPLAVGVGLLVAVVVLPSTVHSMQTPQLGHAPGFGREIATLERLVRPGDAVAGPSWVELPVDWYFGLAPKVGSPPSQDHIYPYVFVPRPGRPTGRIWLVDGADQPIVVDGLISCAPPIVLGDGPEIRCLERPR